MPKIKVNNSYYQNLFRKNSLYAYATLVSSIPVNAEEYKKVILVNIDSFNHFKVKEPILTFTTRCKELEEHELVILGSIINTNYNIDKDVRKFGEFLNSKLTIEELKVKYEGDEEYMDIARKVEQFMKDNNLVQYYDLEASHKFEVEDSFNTGKNEGKKEERITRSMEIAKNLLNLNIDLSTIMKSTGLSKQEIMRLQEN